jgi:hypothetical protein
MNYIDTLEPQIIKFDAVFPVCEEKDHSFLIAYALRKILRLN